MQGFRSGLLYKGSTRVNNNSNNNSIIVIIIVIIILIGPLGLEPQTLTLAQTTNKTTSTLKGLGFRASGLGTNRGD